MAQQYAKSNSDNLYVDFLSHLTTIYSVHLPLRLNLHPTKKFLTSREVSLISPAHKTTRATCTYLTNPQECIIDVATKTRTRYAVCSLIAHEFRHAMYRAAGVPSTKNPKEEWDATKFGTMEAKKYFKLNNLSMEGNSLE